MWREDHLCDGPRASEATVSPCSHTAPIEFLPDSRGRTTKQIPEPFDEKHMRGEITIDLRDGRREEFVEMVVLKRGDNEWIRCVRDKQSPRQRFPETTKYYNLEEDVTRIVIELLDE